MLLTSAVLKHSFHIPQVFFVESVCEDPDVIAENIVVSLRNAHIFEMHIFLSHLVLTVFGLNLWCWFSASEVGQSRLHTL